jgi:hypothetical protein
MSCFLCDAKIPHELTACTNFMGSSNLSAFQKNTLRQFNPPESLAPLNVDQHNTVPIFDIRNSIQRAKALVTKPNNMPSGVGSSKPRSVLTYIPTTQESAFSNLNFFTNIGSYNWQHITRDPAVLGWIKDSIAQNHYLLENISLILSCYESLVIFPVVARGDMNAYKYVNCGREGKKVFTVIACNDKPKERKGILHNNNLYSHMQHLTSMPDKIRPEHIVLPLDYALKLKEAIESLQQGFTRSYDSYDNWLYTTFCVAAVQDYFDMLRPNISQNFLAAIPRVSSQHLVIININGRISEEIAYDARNMRHSTDPDILKALMESVDSDQNFDLMLTGDKLPFETDIPFIDFTCLWLKKLNRFEQRSIMNQVCKNYHSTVYLGMQSGVNEDAVLLHNTNVFSICENLSTQQVGLERVTQKMLRHNKLRQTPFNNFFVIRNTSFLTPVGQLAAHQLAKNPLRDHTLTYREFVNQIVKIREQLKMLDEKTTPNVEQFSSQMLNTGYEIQSDDEDDLELSLDEDDILVAKDGTALINPQTVLKKEQYKHFKRLKKTGKNGVSRNNRNYVQQIDGRYLRRTSKIPITIINSELAVSCHQLIANFNSNQDIIGDRTQLVSLIIHNILTITCHAKQDNIHHLFNAMFTNIKLLNSHLCLGSDSNESLRVVSSSKHIRRQSKDYRPGFHLSAMALQTERQQNEYMAQVTPPVRDDSSDSDDEQNFFITW